MYVPNDSAQLFPKCFFFTVIYEYLHRLNMPLNLFESREIITALTLGMGKLGDLGCSVETWSAAQHGCCASHHTAGRRIQYPYSGHIHCSTNSISDLCIGTTFSCCVPSSVTSSMCRVCSWAHGNMWEYQKGEWARKNSEISEGERHTF